MVKYTETFFGTQHEDPASPVDADLPSENTLLLHLVLVMPMQSPNWTTCLVTDITICAMHHPWSIKGITLETIWSWQEVRSAAVWRKYSPSKVQGVRGRSSPSHGKTPKPLRNK